MARALPLSTEVIGYCPDHWLVEEESASGCSYAPGGRDPGAYGVERGASNRTGERLASVKGVINTHLSSGAGPGVRKWGHWMWPEGVGTRWWPGGPPIDLRFQQVC